MPGFRDLLTRLQFDHEFYRSFLENPSHVMRTYDLTAKEANALLTRNALLYRALLNPEWLRLLEENGELQ